MRDLVWQALHEIVNILHGSRSLHTWNHIAGSHHQFWHFEPWDTTSIESMLIKKQVLWTDHVIGMEQHRIPRRLLYGELLCDKASRPTKERVKRRDKTKFYEYKIKIEEVLPTDCVGVPLSTKHLQTWKNPASKTHHLMNSITV